MAVELATLEDLDRVVELWVALATEQREHGSHLTAGPNRDLIREALAQHVVDHTCLVARADPAEEAAGEEDEEARGEEEEEVAGEEEEEAWGEEAATPDGDASTGTPAAPAPIVGFVSFNVERDGLDRDHQRGVVQNLYVVPPARDRGLGGALLEAAEASLMAAGVDRVVLEAMAANEGARRFYERRGYAPHRVTYERRPADGRDTKER